jgi:hypothetical protein
MKTKSNMTNNREIKTRVKHIRCYSQFVEKEIQDFLDSLTNPAQLIYTTHTGEGTNNSLMSILIFYQG